MKIRRDTIPLSLTSLNTISSLLIALQHKVICNVATLVDTELLVQAIIRYLTGINEIELKTRRATIHKLTKEHLYLCTFLIETYKKTKAEQLIHLDYANFGKYLQTALIQPMILTLADTTTTHFISPCFGSISVINLYAEQNYTCHELTNLDLDLLKISKNTYDNWASPLLPYLQTFSLLNRDSCSILTPKTNKLLFHYLMNFSARKTGSKQEKAPRILFAAADVVHMFQIPDAMCNPLESITLKQEKMILVSIDKKLPFNKILHNIFYEFQQIFNSYFVQHTHPLTGFTKHGIATFIQFISSLQFSNPIFTEIAINIRKILTQLHDVETNNLPLDTLSSLLTPLLFNHSDIHIRELIKEIFFAIDSTYQNQLQHDNCLNMCNSLSNAFFCIEHTLHHLTHSLCQFNAHFINEFIALHFTDNANFNDLRCMLKNLMEDKSNHQSWQELMRENTRILAGGQKLLDASTNPSFCCISQIEQGNYKQLKTLLYLGKQNINKLDKKGYPLLAHAVINNRRTIYKLLLELGGDIHWKGNNTLKNTTLLHLAASFGSFELIPALVTQGLSVFNKDSDKNTPLLLLAIYLSTADTFSVVTEKLSEKKIYQSSIKALATLLSYSSAEPAKNNFYLSLIAFRKNLALINLVHTQTELKNTIPPEIIKHISTQFSDNIPCIAYKKCYQDLSKIFYNNETLFSSCIRMGMRSIFTDLQQEINDNQGFLRNLFSTRTSTPPPAITNKNPLSEQEQAQLLNFYTPRNLHAGVTSMVAVTLAQRTPIVRNFFEEKRFRERRLAIDLWKKKVAKNEDEGLVKALLDACNVLNIKEIDHEIYHKLSALLHHLVIELGNTPINYTPDLFKTDLIHNYLEPENTDNPYSFGK